MSYPQPSNAVDLAFTTPASSGVPTGVDLTFGATTGGPSALVGITVQGRFKLRMSATVGFDASVFRGLATSIHVPHQSATRRPLHMTSAWSTPQSRPAHNSSPYDNAVERPAHTAARWTTPVRSKRNTAACWGATTKHTHHSAEGAWAYGAAQQTGVQSAWQEPGHRVRHSALGAYGHAKATPKGAVSPWQEAQPLQLAVTSHMNQAAKALRPTLASPWQTALVLHGGNGPRYLPLPTPVVPPPSSAVQDLRFCALYPDGGNTSPFLIFGFNPCGAVMPDAPIYTLPARYYMAVHSIEAHLLPGLIPVPIYDVSLAADAGSFAWGFSARGPAALFDALAPSAGVPAQIRITLDGMQWVFIVDSLQRQHEFGKAGARIAGRSATAAVGAPYSRELARLNATAQNAQQLAAAALHLTGVGLDWGIADWLVPAGAWSHSGTPLAAVQAIAEAAGGYVNSHRSAPTLMVRHPYPTLPGGVPGGPWNWGGAFAADVELAPDSIITSSIERRDGPDLDGIYVSGTNQGVLALVRRTGTTGSKLAAMVTDPLITANAAAQQRGLSVLGQSGPKHIVQISMPILTGGANPGVLDVGQLVQINESVPWRGRVRSVGVQASMPTARQQITLERHL